MLLSKSDDVNFILWSIGSIEVFQVDKLDSTISSIAYFLWLRQIPCFDLATSIPRKYFNYPESFM